MDRKTDRKNETKEEPRVDFFSVPQKWKFWYFGFGSILGNFIVFATIFQECDEEWLEILGLAGANVAAVAAVLALLFATLESLIGLIVKLNQRCLEKRTARHREIAEKIKWAVEGSGSNPNHFNELVKNQAFRLLEKHRPPRFSRIRKRKSREYNKMIAKEILCAMQINLRGELNNFDEELEKRAFQALEKYRPKPLFLRKWKR